MTELTIFSYPGPGEHARFKVAIDLDRAEVGCRWLDEHGAPAGLRRSSVGQTDGSLGVRARDAVGYLAAGYIRAEVRTDLSFRKGARTVITEQIEILKDAYNPMGGFGHSRLREEFFGGGTEHMRAHCPVPILLRH